MPPFSKLKSLSSFLVLLLCLLTAQKIQAQETWYAAYDRAIEAISAGRWQEAIQDLNIALRLKPEPETNARTYGMWRKDYLPHYYLGLAWFNLGDYQKALDEFETSRENGAIQNVPELDESLKGYLQTTRDRLASSQKEKQNKELIEAAIERALEFEKQGDLEEAKISIETAKAYDQENTEVNKHWRRIVEALGRKDDQARLQDVERLIASGRESIERGTLKAAQDTLERALKLSPQDQRINQLLAEVAQRNRQLSAEEGIRLNLVDSLIVSGRKKIEQGEYDKAAEDLRRAMQLDPSNRLARLFAARADSLSIADLRIKRQYDLVQEAAVLMERDSLIHARDRLILAQELGLNQAVDSLMDLIEKRLNERQRLGLEHEASQLVLNLPADSARRVKRPELALIATAFDNDGIRRIELEVNGNRRILHPDSSQKARVDSLPTRLSFEESVRLTEGINRIEISLYDRLDNAFIEKRTVDYYPPFWRSRAFLMGWMILLLISGGGYYYYRRNAMRQFLDRFRRRPFELIQPNPFIVGNPIRSREMFFGREDDFRFVKNKVDNEQYGSLIVLFGERRAGKTSVMYQILGGRLGPHYLPVFIDMQAMAVNDDHEFLGRIAELTVRAASGYGREFDLSEFEDRSRNPFVTFERFIDSLIEVIGQDKLLFLVDEYELIENKVTEGKISKDIFLFLSGLVEHKSGLFLVFAGTHLLQEREQNYWQTLLQRCDYRNISFLTANDARRLIQEPVAGQVFYLGSSVVRILRLTAGQPFYTQLVCRNIVEFLNAERRNYFYEDDVAPVIREIVDNPPPQMIYFWAGLQPDEKLTLSAVAEQCRNPEHYCGFNEVAELLKKSAIISPETVRRVLENMIAREILEQNMNRRFRFRMDLFRHWIREEHQFNKLLREFEHGVSASNHLPGRNGQ